MNTVPGQPTLLCLVSCLSGHSKVVALQGIKKQTFYGLFRFRVAETVVRLSPPREKLKISNK